MSVALVNGRVLRDNGFVEGECVLLEGSRIHATRRGKTLWRWHRAEFRVAAA